MKYKVLANKNTADLIIRNPELGLKMLFFSGGSALNYFVPEIKKYTYNTIHIIPISDNGGSSAEILKKLGGSAIGDIRSRLIRLAVNISPEVEELMMHRFDENNKKQAQKDFTEIISGTHRLFSGIKARDTGYILGPLNRFSEKIDGTGFDLRNGSVGNFFFTGCRIMFRNKQVSSLQTAINFFSEITGIPENTQYLLLLCQKINGGYRK